jgi:hypothetical protein
VGGGETESVWEVVRVLFRNKVWITAVLGYSAWSFTIGAFAVWSPTFLYKVFKIPLEEADVQFGAITLLNGLLGTAAGGVMLDFLVARLGADVITASLGLVCGLTAASIPFLLAAFLVHEPWVFYFGLIVGEFFLFSTMSPINGVFLWCVAAKHRSMSVAVMNILIHLLGDVFSPALAGGMWQATDNARLTMACVSAWLTWGVLFFGLSSYLSYNTHSGQE